MDLGEPSQMTESDPRSCVKSRAILLVDLKSESVTTTIWKRAANNIDTGVQPYVNDGDAARYLPQNSLVNNPFQLRAAAGTWCAVSFRKAKVLPQLSPAKQSTSDARRNQRTELR